MYTNKKLTTFESIVKYLKEKFNISIKNNEDMPTVIKDVFPENVEVFHWHGDTFEIPQSAVHFASSEACSNQGFILNDRVIGLQFHIETTGHSADLLVDNCSDELDGSVFVQSEKEIKAGAEKYTVLNQVLFDLLENLVKFNQ